MSPLTDNKKITVKLNQKPKAEVGHTEKKRAVFQRKDLNVWYTETHALRDINLSINERVTI